MIRIKVTSEVLPSRTLKSGKQGPRQQVAYAATLKRDGTPEPFPIKTLIPIWADEQPLKEGDYTLAPQSIYVGEYSALSLSPRLVPVNGSASR